MSNSIVSLVNLRPGQVAVVKRIFFDATRERCALVGIREGSRVRCVDNGSDGITLTVNGAAIELGRSWSHLVQIDQALDGAAATGSGGEAR